MAAGPENTVFSAVLSRFRAFRGVFRGVFPRFERCTQLERELSSSKGGQEDQLESKVAELEKAVELKETANKKLVATIHKLDGDVQSLRSGAARS